MTNYLKFGSFDTRDFNTVVGCARSHNSAVRAIKSYGIPGRGDTLHVDQGYFNPLRITYNIGIIIDGNTETVLSDIRSKISENGGVNRLEDSFNPNTFRFAKLRSGFETVRESKDGKTLVFDLDFECDAKRFTVDGEQEISIPGDGSVLYEFPNLTKHEAVPVVKFITTSTSGTVRIGLFTVNFTNVPVGTNFVIDGNIMDAVVDDGTNSTRYNSKFVYSGSRRLALPANNVAQIMFNGVSDLRIIPRWWGL